MDQIYLQTKAVVEELGEKAGLKAGQILVVGCSTSEVLGAKIGSNSSPEVAKYIFKALQEYSAETGVHIAIPESCVGIVKGRSGLAFNHDIIAHDGTIDYGYTGSVRVKLFNLGKEPYTVKREDRIAQLLIQPVVLVPFELVEKLERTERGSNGFGSTGR